MAYKSNEKQIMLPDDFLLPFGGKLDKENRWVKLAALIPWWKFEDKYRKNFKNTFHGQGAFSVRVALGSLIIKTRLGLSDEETVHQIAENCYMQYFLGYPKFKEGSPFASSLITHFRKRFNADILNEVNDMIPGVDKKNDNNNQNPPRSGGGDVGKDEPAEASDCAKSGKMLLDATCTPADIQYPTDVRILNESREKLETIIDILHSPQKGTKKKSRTYRQKAHENYINFTKQRKPNWIRLER